MTEVKFEDNFLPCLGVYASHQDVLVQHVDGSFYGYGRKIAPGRHNTDGRDVVKVPSSQITSNIKKIINGKRAQLILTEDHRLYARGRHDRYSFGYENRSTDFVEFKELTFFKCRLEQGEHLVDIAMGR